MSISDPISDMLARIKNGLNVKKEDVLMPYSKINFELANLLKKEGYLSDVSKVTAKNPKFEDIKLTLKYTPLNEPIIHGIKRVSKPGQRIYEPVSNIKRVLGGIGTAVVSTSQGLLTDDEARKKGIGGEVLFKIW